MSKKTKSTADQGGGQETSSAPEHFSRPEHPHVHASHPTIAKRLKRANGHLAHVIEMIEAHQTCNNIAQQLHAVERAIVNAKRALIQDHIDHCLEDSLSGNEAEREQVLTDFKAITKYL